MASTRLRQQLLEWEIGCLRQWFAAFEDIFAAVGLAPSGETLWIRDFPLPDGYAPDRVSMAMIVKNFPDDPPKGIYLLSDETNSQLLRTLRRRFNIFQERAFHGAPTISGTEWICVGYLDGWRYDIRNPAGGDNIRKMLQEFWRLLEEA